jgi:hypothetical protein
MKLVYEKRTPVSFLKKTYIQFRQRRVKGSSRCHSLSGFADKSLTLPAKEGRNTTHSRTKIIKKDIEVQAKRKRRECHDTVREVLKVSTTTLKTNAQSSTPLFFS